MASAITARMFAGATMGTRHSARLPPHVPFQHYETSPRKMFNVRKKRKGKGKKPRKPIKAAPDDDGYLDFPFSSVASRTGLFSASVPSATSLVQVPASEQVTVVDNAALDNATIAQTASQTSLFSASVPSTTPLGLYRPTSQRPSRQVMRYPIMPPLHRSSLPPRLRNATPIESSRTTWKGPRLCKRMPDYSRRLGLLTRTTDV